MALLVSASCQIYTKVGPDGYNYPKPMARFNLPAPMEEPVEEPIEEPKNDPIEEPAVSEKFSRFILKILKFKFFFQCANGGSGPFCCTNGADNVDCCDNGGLGADCCTNGGRGQFCCDNGANNADCCENGGSGPYCCTNGVVDNADCSLPTPPPLPSFVPVPNFPKIIPVQPAVRVAEVAEEVEPEPVEEDIPEVKEDVPEVILPVQTPPPLPSFVPIPNLPKIIPVKPVVASTPAPFAAPKIQPRISASTKSPNEYLPPLDARGDFTSDWVEWKVSW